MKQISSIVFCIDKLCTQNKIKASQTAKTGLLNDVKEIKNNIDKVEEQLDSIQKQFKEELVDMNEDEMAELIGTFEALTKENSSLVIFETGGSNVRNMMLTEIDDLRDKIKNQREKLQKVKKHYSANSKTLGELFEQYKQEELEL